MWVDYSNKNSILAIGVRTFGLSCTSSLKDGKIVSRKGVIEFVEPLVLVNPRLRITFFKLNEDARGLKSNMSVFVKTKTRLVLNDENGFLLPLKSVYNELTTIISACPLK